ncbi:MAG: DHA2 family efflux MFS transporter permease subunit [bacterium]
MEQLSARSPAVTYPAKTGVLSRIDTKWLVLIATSLGIFMGSLDATIANVAFPSIGRTFPDASRASLSWVLNGYTIAFAALLIVSGRMADRVGRRPVFFAGLAVFTVASVGCGLAPSEQALIASRVIQGAGAAMMIPSSLGLLLAGWPAAERATAVGLWGAVSALAAATGPSLGALIVDGPGWRWAFLLNVPIGLAAFALGRVVLKDSKNPEADSRFDIPGVLLISVTMGALALGIVEGREWGWSSGRIIGSFAIALGSIGLFLLQERRHAAPVVDLSLFRVPSFSIANVAMLAYATGFFAILLGNILFLTSVWHYSTLRAGLAITPAPILAAVLAAPSGRYAAKHGYRRIIVPGSVLMVTAMLYLAIFVGETPNYLVEWFPAAVILGMGIGLSFAHLSGAAVASLPPQRFAVGSAISQTARNTGGMIGVAALIAILGTPGSTSEAMTSFHHIYFFAATMFAICGIGALALRPKRA